MVRSFRRASILCFLFIGITAIALGQSGDDKPATQPNAPGTQEATANNKAYESNRKYAFELYDQNKFTEALPLLEQLAAQNPKDAVVMEIYGAVLLSTSAGVA